jgi:hypothetical protein
VSSEGTDGGYSISQTCLFVGSPHGSVAATGILKNFNTIEEFKAVR